MSGEAVRIHSLEMVGCLAISAVSCLRMMRGLGVRDSAREESAAEPRVGAA